MEANWPAHAYPALCAAAALGLARWRPLAARAATALTVALGTLLLAGFAAVQLWPGALDGAPAVERFHGWRQAASDVRAATRAACAALGCDPAQPFLVTQGYQVAGELAFYGGYRRFGLVSERPSQFDLWDERPEPGEPFFFVGADGPTPALRRLAPAEGEGSTVRLPRSPAGELAGRPGERWRPLSVTAFARARPGEAWGRGLSTEGE